MGKDANDLKKKATRFLAQVLSDGKGYTFADLERKVMWEFGLGESFVRKFLLLYSPAIDEDEGVFRWK